MREALYDFCIANRKETLLSQWDCEKHAPLGPSNVSQGSHERVFWRCENNHVWNAAVYARTKAVDARIVRDADTADGHDRKQKKGLVGVRLWPRLESRYLLARRQRKMRLSGLCRNDDAAVSVIPEITVHRKVGFT